MVLYADLESKHHNYYCLVYLLFPLIDDLTKCALHDLNLTGKSFGFTAYSEPMAFNRPQDTISNVRGK